MKRQTSYDKKCSILRLMDTVCYRYNAAKTHKCAYTASQIAKELGYKSGNSVRKELYELVDRGAIRMHVYNGKGVTDSECWFLPLHANNPYSLELFKGEN